ncbi:hypothetical protein ACFVS2_26865 [Brevibacillus sp. NPDC058079]|uniref:hypothetical protein n=1 Tax=Brevibacillus sp. NPDC058079 TaxID=3346330 RepID=UPI0036E10104
MGTIIKRVEIKEVHSDEVGKFTSVFYYKLHKVLRVGLNENGEPTEAFCTFIIQHQNPIDYEFFHQEVYRNELAQNGNCDPKYIIPISKEEYEEEMKHETINNQ